jgi:hypothetical protein
VRVKIMTLYFPCIKNHEKNNSLIIELDTLNYDKEKILEKNKWIETGQGFLCPKCRQVNI